MIRPILTELALFIVPFAAYVLYLWATRADILHPDSWPLKRLIALSAVALLLMAASLVHWAQTTGDPRGSPYVPAHIENGKLVPGTAK
jgi:hypothetical protein